MGKIELVSIVMPAYNAEKTIERSIASVLEQTYKKWELIIIDDCSVDATYQIVKGIERGEYRITVLRNQMNSGVSVTRNKGILAATGNWIAFLDSDDMWMPDKLEKQMRIVKKNNGIDLVFTGSSFINKTGTPLAYCLKVPESITYRTLLKQNVISCSSVLVRKTLAIQFPMKHDDMHEDYAVWLQILKSGGQARGINEPLLIYQLSNESKSGDKKRAAIMTFKVYKFIGLNDFQLIYYFSWYALKNIKKYFLINRSI